MPVRNSNPANQSLKHYKSLSYETLAESDGSFYYRVRGTTREAY